MRTKTRWIVSLAAVGAACAASQTIAFASEAASGSFATGCTTMAVGSGCSETFRFLDASGQPVSGVPVTFTVKGVKGSSVNPTKQTTDSSGEVTTGLFAYNQRTGASTGTGTVTLTAKSEKVSASVTITFT